MKKPRVGVFKLTSCDGCQLSILNIGEDLVALLNLADIAYFREATARPLRGHFDIALVEGSVSTEDQRGEIAEIRERAHSLITIGACATSGGLQALRNWANLTAYKQRVYPTPDVVRSLPTSTPVSDHVPVDYELWGCPINTAALTETLVSLLLGRRPGIPGYSLCMECKREGIPCILVSKGEPCLGPVTRAGCGVLCPSLLRPCYGCFGPREGANIEALFRQFGQLGLTDRECMERIDAMNTLAFRKARIEGLH